MSTKLGAWRTSVATMLTLVAIAAHPGAQSTREHSRLAMREALRDLLVTMDRPAARERLQAIVSRDPDYAEAAFNLALLTEADGGVDAARKLYAHVASLTSSGRTAEQAAAALRRLRADLPPAQRNAADYAAIVRQASAFDAAGLAAVAAARASDAVSLQPGRWEAYAVSASALNRLQRHDQASQMIAEAIRRAPDDVKVRLISEQSRIDSDRACAPTVTKAIAAYRAGRFSDAAEAFSAVLQGVCGGREQLGLAAVQAYIKANDVSRATALIDRLLRSENAETVITASELAKSLK